MRLLTAIAFHPSLLCFAVLAWLLDRGQKGPM